MIGSSHYVQNTLDVGRSYVIYGTNGFNSLNVVNLNGQNGFLIKGAFDNHQLGRLATSAGDFNGDGYDDLFISAYGTIDTDNDNYIIYGGANLNQASYTISDFYFDSRFLITNQGSDVLGQFLNSAGDINNDGYDDVYIKSNTSKYIVFGRPGYLSGCTDPNYCEYNPTAVCDDGSCAVLNSQALTCMADCSTGSIEVWNDEDCNCQVFNVQPSNIDISNDVIFDGNEIKSINKKLNSINITNTYMHYAGDVNADGYDDMLIGADASESVFVLYGSDSKLTELDVLNLDPQDGFRIVAESGTDLFGYTISNAGDFDNDGFDDFLISAPHEFLSAAQQAGVVYLIYGQASFPQPLKMADLNGQNGFKLSSGLIGDGFGTSISSAGDINADGFDDIILSAPFESTTYVIYGSNTYNALNYNVNVLVNNGLAFKISSTTINKFAGLAVNEAGDFNNDGFNDIIVGVPKADNFGDNNEGAVFVIYGNSASLSNIDLDSFTAAQGVKILGKNNFNRIGHDVASGDFNADGISDVLIGSNFVSGGEVYVVYGSSNSTAVVDLNNLGSNLVTEISTSINNEKFGQYVDFIQDINADGYDDILISARANNNAQGKAYVMYGSNMQLSNLQAAQLNGSNGFSISGPAAQSNFSASIGGIGDFNNDGLYDFAIGSWGTNSGYVIYGDANSITGCTDPSNLNFDAAALCDDGSCY